MMKMMMMMITMRMTMVMMNMMTMMMMMMMMNMMTMMMMVMISEVMIPQGRLSLYYPECFNNFLAADDEWDSLHPDQMWNYIFFAQCVSHQVC